MGPSLTRAPRTRQAKKKKQKKEMNGEELRKGRKTPL